MILKLPSKNILQTESIASKLSLHLKEKDVVLLTGELGAGKTEFVKGLCKNYNEKKDGPVVSPTFTLINEYNLNKKIYHIDLYRINTLFELEELGIDKLNAINGNVLIE